MRYRLITQPTVGPGKVTEELDRLLKNAKRLTTSLVVVGPPHKRLPMTATVLEVPDPFAPMATRVLEVILGPSGHYEPLLAVTMRDEWTNHALLVPQKGAQSLVESLFEGWSSACLHLHWRVGRCVGVIHYSAGDAARVTALAAHGWKARPVPANAAGALAAARLGPSWVGRVTHPPFLGKSLITPTPQGALAVPFGGKSMTPTSLFSDPQESVFQRGSTPGGGAPRKGALANAAGGGTVVAPSGADGFPLGTTPHGQAVKLAWHALLLAVVAPEDREREMALTLIARAAQHDLGLIAVVGQSLVSSRQLAAWSTRVRALDPRNLWESHAIPWQRIDPLLLREALSAAGVETPESAPLPATFGAFLAAIPGGEQYCTERVLALTAPAGDDLRGVVAAGGGVLLIDDGSPSGRLLSMLLFALLASDPPTDRRMLIIRPAHIRVPDALAQRAIQVVFGEDARALGTLRARSDSWRLTHADGSPATELDADLNRPPSALDGRSYGTLMDTLDGRKDAASRAQPEAQPLISAPAVDLLDDAGDDPFATPFAASVRQAQPAAVEDDLFIGSLNLSSPFMQAAPASAAALSDDLFAFDSATAAPTAARPAAAGRDIFSSFFDIALDEEAMQMPAPGAATDLGDFAPAYGLPSAATTDDGSLADIFAQPLDALASAPWQEDATAADAVAPAPAPVADDLGFDMLAMPLDVAGLPAPAPDAGELGFDMFATPLDFAGLGATAADVVRAAQPFVAANDFSSPDSIFPTFGADEPWGLGGSFDVPSAGTAADSAQEQTWGLGLAGESPAAGGVFELPTGADNAATPQESADVRIVAPDFQGWPAAPDAMTSWISAPWLGGEETDTTAQPYVVEEPASAVEEPARLPIANVVEPAVSAPEERAAASELANEGAAAETAAVAGQPLAASRRWTARRHRLRRPVPRVSDDEAAAEAPSRLLDDDVPGADLALVAPDLALTAQPGNEDDVITDDLTLALTQGDLDLTTAPSFDGPEFALPPMDVTTSAVMRDEPQRWAGALAPVAADDLPHSDALDGELFPVLDDAGAFDFGAFGDMLPVLEQDAPVAQDALDEALTAPEEVAADMADWPAGRGDEMTAGDQVLVLPISLDVPDAADLGLLDEALATTEEVVADMADLPAAPGMVEQRAPHGAPPAFPALEAAMPRYAAIAAAPAALAFDADAVYAAWRGGAGMAALIELVARTNPGADRSSIRRAIRALLDARTAAGPALPATPAAPLWSMGTPGAGNGAQYRAEARQSPALAAVAAPCAVLNMAGHAPLVPNAVLYTPAHAPLETVAALNMAGHAPLEPHSALVTAADQGMLAPALVTRVDLGMTAMSSAPDVTLDMAGHAPLEPHSALVTAGHAPLEPHSALVTAANPGLPAAAPASHQALEDTVLPLDADVALPDGDDRSGDAHIWVRWANNEELTDIIRALCGYTRGRAADAARDRVYRVVAPRIVAELDAELLVTRLLDGRLPLRSQGPQLEQLLRRMNRQAGPVTGVIREKTIARLVTAMREARAYAHAAA